MPTITDVFKNIGEMIDKQNKVQDNIVPAGDYYKGATENLVTYLETLNFHVEDLIYSDSYFIFGKGTNSVISFHVKETPDWLYGIWWEVCGIDYKHPRKSKKELIESLKNKEGSLKATFFCQYEPEINKFKPSRSAFCEKMIIPIFSTPDEWTYREAKEIIEFIHKEPYLAWMHDYMDVDFNREYHSREEAEEEFLKYFAKKQVRIQAKKDLSLEWLQFLNEGFANQPDRIRVLDNGECWSPRFELFFVWDDFSDRDVFDEDEEKEGRASCYLPEVPFDYFGINLSEEKIKNKEKEMEEREFDGETFCSWEYNSTSDWLEFVSAEKYATWEKEKMGLPTLSDFIQNILPTLNVFD